MHIKEREVLYVYRCLGDELYKCDSYEEYYEYINKFYIDDLSRWTENMKINNKVYNKAIERYERETF